MLAAEVSQYELMRLKNVDERKNLVSHLWYCHWWCGNSALVKVKNYTMHEVLKILVLGFKLIVPLMARPNDTS